MNYYKIITYAEGEDFETRERIINEDVYKLMQKAMAEGAEFIDLGDKGIIRRSSIKEIAPANDIVSEYQKEGVKIDGILDAPDLPKLSGDVRQPKTAEQIIKDTHFDLYKKHGWEHKDSCVCKSF